MQQYKTIVGYNHISQAVDEANEKLRQIRSGELQPLRTSSQKETDKIGGFFPTDQVTIAARTGIGKSAYILNIIKDLVNRDLNPKYADNMIVLYDSWEMPEWRNVIRMYSRERQMSVKDILDYEKNMAQEVFDRMLLLSAEFKGLPIYFRTISDNVKDWYDMKYRIQEQNPDKLIINVADHTRLVTKGNEKSEEELITNFMKAGMKIKLEMNQINFFLSQMNRAIETSGKREEIGIATPVSSDIFGADSVYQCSDIVIAHHRPGFYGIENWNDIPTGRLRGDPDAEDHLWVECILKQRDGWTGNLIRHHNLAHNMIMDEMPVATFNSNSSLF